MSEKVLIVGSGAREHAIATALLRSRERPELICFGSGNNPGISAHTRAYASGDLTDAVAIEIFARANAATLAIVGPEAPLAAGVADALRHSSIAVVGPQRDLARIESSKSFARHLLETHNIPGNPAFQRFTSMDGVREWLARLPQQHVVKDDGLAGGKGVKVYGDHLHSLDESLGWCEELAAAGRAFVLEEKLEGEEFSLMSFTDGVTVHHMPAVQDHKRAFVGDTGPNTGGMGTYSDADGKLPFLRDTDIAAARAINEKVVKALREECGEPYQGILYGGFIATADGVRLIEYNARFGDPESLNLLTLLDSDFLAICRGIAHGNLSEAEVRFQPLATVCKYLVPEGYPDAARRGDEVNLPEQLPHGVAMYLGSVDTSNGRLIAMGSRTVAFVGTGATLADAERLCQQAAASVAGPFFFRPDIGTPEAITRRVAHMEALRGR